MENQIAPVIYLFSVPTLRTCSILTFFPLCLLSFCTFRFPRILFPSKIWINLSWFPRVSQNLPPSTFIHSPVSPYLLPSLLPSVQWRASGWSGGRGRDAAWLATREPSRGRGAAVRRCTAGLSVRAPMRRAENAPTLPAVVRHTNELLVFTLTCSQMPLCKHGTCIIERHLFGLLWFVFHI